MINSDPIANVKVQESGGFTPISRSDVKDALNISASYDDGLIDRYLPVARRHFERKTSHYLVAQDRKIVFPEKGLDKWKIPAFPWMSLESVDERDEDSTSSADTSKFWVLSGENPPVVRLKDTKSIDRTSTHLEFTVKVGYASEDDIPDDVLEAVIKITSDLYEHRISTEEEDISPDDVPMTWTDLLAPHKLIYLP